MMTFKFQMKKKNKKKNLIVIKILHQCNIEGNAYSFKISFDYDEKWQEKLKEIIQKIEYQNKSANTNNFIYFELIDKTINIDIFAVIKIKSITYYDENSESFLIEYYPLLEDLSNF
tara:strand:- start:67 stop:414 length:348 start_codon:yes stop_codon:yes gene_type:complete